MSKKVLIIVAHPDDEVLGCGGTIARLSKEGCEVFIAILGEGITSRFIHREEANMELITELHNRSKEVAELLGGKDLFMHSLPDNRFDTVPLLDIVKIIETMIEKIKPSIIYTHFAGDLNIDHAITNRAVITATRPTEGHPVKEIYTFEVPSSTEWAFGQYNKTFSPNVFLDINETLDIKIKAMEMYDTESRTFPHPRSPESLRAIAQRWGSVVGIKASEAFELVRLVRTIT